MSCILRRDPAWLQTLYQSDQLALLSEDGCQVPVPAVLLLAVSPLVSSMMADLLPPAHSQHVLSIPVPGDVLLIVRDSLSKGTVIVKEDMKREVVNVFNMMMIESFLSSRLLDNHASLDYIVNMNATAADCTKGVEESANDDQIKLEITVELEKSDENIKDHTLCIPEYEDHSEPHSVVGNLDTNITEDATEKEEPDDDSEDVELNITEKPFSSRFGRVYTRTRSKSSRGEVENKKSEECVKFFNDIIPDETQRTNDREEAPRQLKNKRNKYISKDSSLVSQNHCGICQLECSNISSLKKHMLTVHCTFDETVCKVCGLKTASRGSLKVHLRLHTGEKPYECDHCEYRSTNSGNMTKHSVVHTLERDFSCDLCDFKTNTYSTLSGHKINKHTERKRSRCPFCNYTSIYTNMSKHIKSRHTARSSKKLSNVRGDGGD